MEVETFEVTELLNPLTLKVESPQETVDLINELNLEGQQTLTCKTPEGTDRATPYREMTKEEKFVYEIVLPEHEIIETFKAHIIPLRVLQVYQHALSLGIYTTFKIWHAHEGPDPILLAKLGDEWNAPLHILARWGEVLVPFQELKVKALAAFKSRLIRNIEQIKQQVEQDLNWVKAIEAEDIDQSWQVYYNRLRG